ncbi:cytochrome c family protein [Stappia sp. ES.058]|uniref:c-type cytochrome n=1 Tax=Stappia sp. ES.058 TaxID=1881061 RepID=UPI00087A5179|nr:cytochrome c family protein [Stappia sp. ES.058]SDU46712.1 cytochrome c [Stappia sp. ES.058]
MNSAKLNTIAGAVLFVLLVTMGLGILSDIIFASDDPDKPGYEIVIADTGSEDVTEGEVMEPEVEPIGLRLANASAEDGEKLVRACASCHDFSKGGPNKVGPELWGVVGRHPGSVEDFRYSGAMQEYGENTEAWAYENLDVFLTAPKQLVPGTSMGYAGMRKPGDRADLIAYLRTLSDDPMPLPEAAE